MDSNGGTSECNPKLCIIHKQFLLQIWGFYSKCKQERKGSVGWTTPPPGWLALNLDGAFIRPLGLSTASGVIQDSNGEWLSGFTIRLGRFIAYQVELWGAYRGLCLA